MSPHEISDRLLVLQGIIQVRFPIRSDDNELENLFTEGDLVAMLENTFLNGFSVDQCPVCAAHVHEIVVISKGLDSGVPAPDRCRTRVEEPFFSYHS